MEKQHIKQQFINWFKEKNFNQGISLLMQHKPFKAKMLIRRPKMNLLIYELAKVAGYDPIQARKFKDGTESPVPATISKTTKPKDPAKTKQEEISVETQTGTQKQDKDQTPAAFVTSKDVPAFIAKIVKEHQRLSSLRSQLGDERSKVPQNNQVQNTKKRKMLSQSIQEISDKIEKLYNAKEDYFNNGTVPDLNELIPEQVVEVNPQESIDDLNKRRRNLMSANQKDNVFLKFMDIKVGKKPNPMPKGPERDELQNRIKTRKAEIKAIEAKIKELKAK